MQLRVILEMNGADMSSREWQFAFNHIHTNFSYIEKVEYIKAMPCFYSKGSIVGNLIVSEHQGYALSSESGILAICTAKDDFPVVEWIPKKDIRVVEAENKLFKAYVRVKTNDIVHVFRVDKKKMSELEKMVNEVRNSV